MPAADAEPRSEAQLKREAIWDKRGMKQKLVLAGALTHEPRLLILDEPLTGFKAPAPRSVKDILLEQVAAGGTVILTAHILEGAERTAQRIGINRAEGTTLGQLFLELAQDDMPA